MPAKDYKAVTTKENCLAVMAKGNPPYFPSIN